MAAFIPPTASEELTLYLALVESRGKDSVVLAAILDWAEEHHGIAYRAEATPIWQDIARVLSNLYDPGIDAWASGVRAMLDMAQAIGK